MAARIFSILVLLTTIFSLQECKSVDLGQSAQPETSSADTTMYSCKGKTTCGEMTSCNEATFYLKNCPGVTIDGDGDGIPCEDQWCH
jgi:hypothetical protein